MQSLSALNKDKLITLLTQQNEILIALKCSYSPGDKRNQRTKKISWSRTVVSHPPLVVMANPSQEASVKEMGVRVEDSLNIQATPYNPIRV